MSSKGKFVTGTMIIENTKPFYDAMKITDKRTFSADSNKKITCKNLSP
jgi:hypothetical protein